MSMSSNDYCVQNIYRYSRKSCKKNRIGSADTYFDTARDDTNTAASDTSPKNERFTISSPGCSCEIDPEGELADILHIKCPVIALAQQQFQKFLEERDGRLYHDKKCSRSVVELFQMCKDALWEQNRCKCGSIFVIVMFCVFLIGLLIGAATCGVSYRKFNSPIFTCIDNFFIPDTYTKVEDTYRGIV